jgi:hypothetical protein
MTAVSHQKLWTLKRRGRKKGRGAEKKPVNSDFYTQQKYPTLNEQEKKPFQMKKAKNS